MTSPECRHPNPQACCHSREYRQPNRYGPMGLWAALSVNGRTLTFGATEVNYRSNCRNCFKSASNHLASARTKRSRNPKLDGSHAKKANSRFCP